MEYSMNKIAYVSVDMEANGPCPGIHSMLSLGAVAFQRDKTVIAKFARNLDLWPNTVEDSSTMEFWSKFPDAFEANRILTKNPKSVMTDFARWVKLIQSDGYKIVFVALPLAYDWKWIDWYFYNTIGFNPFGYGTDALDIKSFVWNMFNCDYTELNSSDFPAIWLENLPHKHIALDDAFEQGIVFLNALSELKK
jgi:hypothetical protein